ncbi:hypothetical protein K440DRAFT_124565 [Wilcoxina mikolae CBS 423.85]|nr:hypothetical protein K440DRAFT_124565 [Wilcoxina mikolae CBS 423.85]
MQLVCVVAYPRLYMSTSSYAVPSKRLTTPATPPFLLSTACTIQQHRVANVWMLEAEFKAQRVKLIPSSNARFCSVCNLNLPMARVTADDHGLVFSVGAYACEQTPDMIGPRNCVRVIAAHRWGGIILKLRACGILLPGNVFLFLNELLFLTLLSPLLSLSLDPSVNPLNLNSRRAHAVSSNPAVTVLYIYRRQPS